MIFKKQSVYGVTSSMFSEKKISKSFIFIALLFLLASCSRFSFSPPGPSNQAVLILPVEVESTAVVTIHAFYHIYEIVSADDPSFTYEAELKFPLKDNMKVIDSLPPGDYIVRRHSLFPIGSGDITGGHRGYERNDEFTLAFGKVTLFPQSLKVKIRNEHPGRMASLLYNFEMNPVTPDQKRNLVETLKSRNNSSLWEIE